jgi:glyoxylate reductase
MKPKVFVSRLIPERGLKLIYQACDAEVWTDEMPPSRDDLRERVKDKVGLLSLLTDKIDGPFLDANPQIRVVSNMAVGFDNIDIPAATERGVPIGNTPGVLTEAAADFAFALLMASARNIVQGADYVRAGKWKTWGPTLLLGADITGATLGIVGFGRIGQALAMRARGFDMRIVYNNLRRVPEVEKMTGASYTDLDTLLADSDFVSVHTDLNEQSRHMFNATTFAKIKRGATFINTARGPIVDQRALYDALKSGHLRAAALDVTDPEPLPMDNPLYTLENCLIVPHIASATFETRGKMAEMAARNLIAGVNGERLPTCVNPEVYEKK